MQRVEPRLTAELRARLARGEHEAVASELASGGDLVGAGQVLEQIWDFLGAHGHYTAAGRPLDALRCALELGRPDLLDATLAQLMDQPRGDRDEAVKLLQRRGRHAEAAGLLATDDADPVVRARALARAGDRRGAAQVLAEAGHVREALRALDPIAEQDAPALTLAATLAWELGDAETSVRHAQAAMRALAGPATHDPGSAGPRASQPALAAMSEGTATDERANAARILARGLGALGHELAAQLVLQATGVREMTSAAVPGRYHVRRALTASYAGAAYDGLDRVTQQEVEIHLLLAEVQDAGLDAQGVLSAIAAFARRAEAAAELAHPAIRPVLRFDLRAGLLILPHADGPTLRTLIRPPGMPPARARALVSFLLDGLVAAHARGLVHGSLLPAQIVCDAAGRPLLGPFGADEIAGLVATRTGALEELLTITAPELRAGGKPSAASDIYSAAALWVALRTGSLGADPARLPADEQRLVADALDPDPARRPDAPTLLGRLRVRVADPRELVPLAPLPAVPKAMSEVGALATAGVIAEVAAGWTDAELDALLASDAPRLQPVLDREQRRVVLAAWPDGCRRLADDADAGALDPLLDGLAPALRAIVGSRLRASSWVCTSAGEWMLALDDLLTR
ncbi:MAG TPA: hypothetical protein VGB85_28380 [Nannocystis sp.]